MNDFDTAKRIRALAHAAALPEDLDEWSAVVGKMPRARRQRTKRRVALGAAATLAMAAAITAVVVLPVGGHQPASAATIAARAAEVLRADAGLPPVQLTEVTTTAAEFQPSAPPRVVEHIDFASPTRWRDAATITLPGGSGTRQLTVIRNGARIATMIGGKASVGPVSGQGGSLFETSAVGQRLAWPSVLAAMGTGRCAPSLTLDRRGPLIVGQSTMVLHVGRAPCPSEAAPETDGPASLWLSTRTYLVLRAELHGPVGQLAQTMLVTALHYHPSFHAEAFALPSPSPSKVPPTQGVSTLVGLRRHLAYQPLLPTQLPAGLRAVAFSVIQNGGVPTKGGKATEFTITYAGRSGKSLVQLYEALSSSPSVRFSGQHISIRSGLVGTVSNVEGLILWWIQDGRYCSLQAGGVTAGVHLGTLPEKALVHIAASFR